MALQFLKDTVFTQGNSAETAAMWFALKEHLKACGWTVPRSSDGTTYNSGGDQITHAGAGAGGMANNRPWFEITNGTVHLTIQPDNTASPRNARIKIGRTAFTAGSPAAQVTPNTPVAGNEAIWKGGGTDASPTFPALFNSSGALRVLMIADDSAPMGFLAIAWDNGGGLGRWIFGADPLLPGTYPGGDTQPYAMLFGSQWEVSTPTSETSLFQVSQVYSPRAWMNNGGTWSFVHCPAMAMRDSGNFSGAGSMGVNHITGDDQGAPIIYARRGALGAPSGVKGVSTYLAWALTARAIGDRITIDSANDHMYVPDVYVPWDGSVPTI